MLEAVARLSLAVLAPEQVGRLLARMIDAGADG